MEMEPRDAFLKYVRSLMALVPEDSNEETRLMLNHRDRKGRFHALPMPILYPHSDLDEWIKRDWADNLIASGDDIYAEQSLQIGAPLKSGGRGTTERAYGYRWLWADFDCAHGNHRKNEQTGLPLPSLDQARDFLHSLDIPPTWIVASGGGFHVYWHLDSWVDARPNQPGASLPAEFNRSLGYLMNQQGFHLDLIGDLVHLLRVPGTWNTKYTPAERVQFEAIHDERVYTVDDMWGWVAEHQPPEPVKPRRASRGQSDGRSIVEKAPWSATPEAVEQWMTSLGIEYRPQEPSQSAHNEIQWPVMCPMADRHAEGGEKWAHIYWRTPTEPEPGQDPEWHMGFVCKHAGHGGFGHIGWRQFHALVDPQWAEQQAQHAERQRRRAFIQRDGDTDIDWNKVMALPYAKDQGDSVSFHCPICYRANPEGPHDSGWVFKESGKFLCRVTANTPDGRDHNLAIWICIRTEDAQRRQLALLKRNVKRRR